MFGNDQTGSSWHAKNTKVFEVTMKNAMPQKVLKGLDNLMGIERPLFAEHVVHLVEQSRKEKQNNSKAYSWQMN